MTYRIMTDLGLSREAANRVMTMLGRSQLSASMTVHKGRDGNFIQHKAYNTVDAMKIIRSRLDYDCMELVRLYDKAN